MRNVHLSDEELQEVALKNTNEQFVDHLASCSKCRKSVEVYSLMFGAIIQESKPLFDFEIEVPKAFSVNAQVRPTFSLTMPLNQKESKSIYYLKIYFWCIIAFILLVSSILLYLFERIQNINWLIFSFPVVGVALLIIFYWIRDLIIIHRQQINKINMQHFSTSTF